MLYFAFISDCTLCGSFITASRLLLVDGWPLAYVKGRDGHVRFDIFFFLSDCTFCGSFITASRLLLVDGWPLAYVKGRDGHVHATRWDATARGLAEVSSKQRWLVGEMQISLASRRWMAPFMREAIWTATLMQQRGIPPVVVCQRFHQSKAGWCGRCSGST